jgi:NADH-quinone oxidoreductase subunit J
MTEVVFFVLSLITLLAALFVVLPRNPIYSALSLLIMMLSLAGIFLQLSAPFLGIMQVVVYAGAVVVLFLFVIMLMNLDPVEMGEEKGAWFKALSFFLVAFLAVFVILAILQTNERKGLPGRFPPRAAADAKEGAPEYGVNFRKPGSLVETQYGEVDSEFGSTKSVGTVLFDPYVVPFELISVLIVIAVVGAVALTKRDP